MRARSRLSRDWLAVLARVWKLDRMLSSAKRHSASAHARAGEAMVQGSPRDLDQASATWLAAAADKREALQKLTRAETLSLSVDREDYAVASRWARPLVITRGIAERAVLRDQIRRTRRELTERCRALAAQAFENQVAALKDQLPGELADEVAAARMQLERGSRERDQLVAPFGGRALPRALHWVAHEVALFFSITSWELKNRFLPRLPALIGLLVGWWIPKTFTHSRTPGILRLLGIGHSGKHYLPAGTFRTLSFWLPIVASILCAYLAGRLGRLIQGRYAPAAATRDGVSPVPMATEERARDA